MNIQQMGALALFVLMGGLLVWRLWLDGFIPIDFRRSWREDDIIHVDSDDVAMEKAMKEAVKTLPTFMDLVKSDPKVYARLKVCFEQGSKPEHIWTKPLRLGKTMTVQLENSARYVLDLRHGDQVKVTRADITDWIVINKEGRYGGYTFDVLLRNMSRGMAAYYERHWFKEAKKYAKHPIKIHLEK